VPSAWISFPKHAAHSALSLLVAGVLANDSHDSASADHLALDAYLLD
jgi:hypothetical protein